MTGNQMIDSFLNAPFWIEIENWPLAWEIGGTAWFPFLESVHVIAAALVVGAIATVDLRLLGLAALRYPIATLNREILPWVWGAFIVATVTGLGMFITRAASHVVNPAFQYKLLLLCLAGINMALLHRALRKLESTQTQPIETALPLRIAGACSLILWCAVMLAGRWVGHIV
jgi:hypothetical protein